MDKVKVGQDTKLKSTGLLDLGMGSYAGKLTADSGGFDIVQSGAISFGSDTDFDAGSAKIDLLNPYNQWRGSIVFKAGIVMINHPMLMNAVNAGTLIVRANIGGTVQSTKVASGGASDSLQPMADTSRTGPAVTVTVAKPSSAEAPGLITVAVSSEAAASGRSFSFELDIKAASAQPAGTSLNIVQLDGKPLPNWLRYEPDTKTFTATDVPAGAFPLQLKVSGGGQETMMVIREQDAKR